MELKKYRLGEIVDFNKETISRQDNLLEIKYLDTSNILDNVIYETPSMKLSEAPSRAQRKVKHLTIIYSTVRPRLKHHGILQMPPENLIVSTGFATLDIKDSYENMIDATYLYLLLTQSSVTEYLGNIADTAVSAYPSINPLDISSLSFIFPDITIQRKIASIWTSYDQKIHLNSVINDNLEAMAKQLYDYWFVQFDFPNEEGKPYKSSGGAMVWNEKLKREIPQGWNDCKIKDFMRIFTGKKDVSKAVPGNYKFFSCAPEPISSNEYVYDGYAVLVSGNGSYTGRVGFYKGKFDLYQRTYACVLDEDEHNISFFYYTLRYLFQPIYSGGKHGSSIPYIVLGDLADFRFAFNETICTKFVDAAKPMFDEQLLRQKEIEALTKQRDELLPLLMNGQASVNYHLSAKVYPLPIAYKKAMPIVANQTISNIFNQKSDSHTPSPCLQTSQIRCS